MIWICRAGQNAQHRDYYVRTSKIYLPWEGFCTNLLPGSPMETYRNIVVAEKHTTAKTSISNWACQLNAFCNEMQIGDFVLVPYEGGKRYIWAQITGEYMFNEENAIGLWHSREIVIIDEDVSSSSFSQSLRYALRAYRTVYKLRKDKELELLSSIQSKC